MFFNGGVLHIQQIEE
jgi:hypothetical protein